MKPTPVFSIDKTDIFKLIEDCTASEIGAFLTVACHTDRTGLYSTAGVYAVRKALGIGIKKAEKLLNNLETKGMIRRPETLHHNSNEFKAIPNREGRAQVRWLLRGGDKEKVWLPNSVVGGYGTWEKPIHDLCACGTEAARLFLALYLYEDMETYGGVGVDGVYGKYDTENLGDYDGVHMFHGERSTKSVTHELYKEVLGFSVDEDGQIPQFWSALASLEKRGFIYEVVTVFTGESPEDDPSMLYPLYTRNKHGHPSKGEESLATATEKFVSRRTGKSCADELGRFYGKFAFISDADKAQLIGIYRLRLRNTNTNYEGVKFAWKTIQATRQYWKKRCA